MRNDAQVLKLLRELSKISWDILKNYYQNTCKRNDGTPAAVAVI